MEDFFASEHPLLGFLPLLFSETELYHLINFSRQKPNAGTYLEQVKIFDHFWGTLRSIGGEKGSQIAHLASNNSENLV